MRVHANLRERMTIHTLTQTRKIQIENHLKITRNEISNTKIKVGMDYMRNPNNSGKKKKCLQETLNVKTKVLSFVRLHITLR